MNQDVVEEFARQLDQSKVDIIIIKRELSKILINISSCSDSRRTRAEQ
jgi:hypothetical protein